MYRESTYWFLTAATSAGAGVADVVNWAELPFSVVVIVVLGILLRFLIKSYEGKLDKILDILEEKNKDGKST